MMPDYIVKRQLTLHILSILTEDTLIPYHIHTYFFGEELIVGDQPEGHSEGCLLVHVSLTTRGCQHTQLTVDTGQERTI